MDSVTHHGRETAYEVTGGGPDTETVCLVHGNGSTHQIWDRQGDLSEDYRLVTPDLSGHGDSEDVTARPGYDTLSAHADDVQAVTSALGATVLVGHSLGGAVVLHTLIERDNQVDAAIVVGCGARLGVLEDLRSWAQSDIDRLIEFFLTPDRLVADPDPSMVSFLRDQLERNRDLLSRDLETCHRWDVRDRLVEVSVPVLAVCGERDRLTPPWYHEYLAAEVPDGELAIIEEACHLPMLERPSRFNSAVSSFLSHTLD